LPAHITKVHILLTHLHMDHIQGLPFFSPLRRQGVEIHVWGPASTTLGLEARLQKYLSPPLFPVSVRELASEIHFHELPAHLIEIGEFAEFCARIPPHHARAQPCASHVSYSPSS